MKANSYSYQLDRSSRKYICPRCGRKTFVLYLDAYGTPLSDDVGRCDRADNCGWHYSPKDYFTDHRTTGTTGTNLRPRWTPPRRPEPEPEPEPSYIPPAIMRRTLKEYDNNSLAIFLHNTFDRLIGPEEVHNIIVMYGVGTAKAFGGSPVFWQVDRNGRIRTGKIMGYDSSTGKRIKEPKPLFQWVHKLKGAGEGFNLCQCYFGSHLLSYHLRGSGNMMEPTPHAPVIWLMESEKAALITALTLRWLNAESMFIPMACGGCQGFNAKNKTNPKDKIRILRNQSVALFPDEGKYEEWNKAAEELRGFCKDIRVAVVMEEDKRKKPIPFDVEKGAGIDDVLLACIREEISPDEIADLLLTSY